MRKRATLYVALAVAGSSLPFIPLLIMAFSFRWDWPNLLPNLWWWQARSSARLPIGWDYLASSSSRLPQALLNTLLIGLCVALVCTLISLPLAYLLAREGWAVWLEPLVWMPLIIPELAVASGLLLIALHLNLAGSYLAVILAHCMLALPYSVRILLSGISSIQPGYIQQARSLGASGWQRWRYVLLPLLLPSLAMAALFAWLISSHLYLVTVLLSQGNIETLPTLLFNHLAGGGLDTVAAELALIAALPAAFVVILAETLTRRSLQQPLL